MNFIESIPFTRRRPALMTDKEFEEVKKHLAEHPDAGDNIPALDDLATALKKQAKVARDEREKASKPKKK